jgi:DnaJ-class molecular chaperone
MFSGARGGARPGGSTFEFDPGGIALDLDLNVAMTVSLEEATNGVEKRVRLPSGKELNVKIPAGVSAGQQIRLKGQGQPDPGGREPGDLILSVRVEPHRFFKREGNAVHCDVPLTLKQAALGSSVKINTVSGKKVMLKIPAGTGDGTVLRIHGMGIEKAGRRGDQFVTIRVEIPKHPSPEEKELLERLKKTKHKNTP